MSTALPPSYTFEMLSKLPPNSFVVQWKEQRPDVEPYVSPAQGSLGQKLKYSFSIRGAPNEFLLNTNTYLCGNSYVRVIADSPTTNVGVAALDGFYGSQDAALKPAYSFFASSRESFNSGALPLLDNQDANRSFEHNTIRKFCTRRNQDRRGKVNDVNGLSGNGFLSNNASYQGIDGGFRLLAQTAPAVWATYHGGNDYAFQIPLGLYSSIINSHSVLPIGLFSSYSVNGWKIDLETAAQTKTAKGVANNGRCWYNNTTFQAIAGSQIEVDGVLNNVRLYYAVVKVLDPAVMSAVLALYEKQEMVNVGGVQFPLSLRLNSINYRYFSFPIIDGTSDYMFRLTGTDRSVRAYAFKIYNNLSNSNGQVGNAVPLRPTRLETHIGTEMPHDVIEDRDGTTNNIANFLNSNARHSASVFSALPYYQEGITWSGQQEDDLQRVNFAPQLILVGNNNVYSVSYGVVSLENLDRREKDYSGSFQACGKDLTNVGAIEVRMRISQPLPGTSATTQAPAYLDGSYALIPPTNANSQIVFMYAYDSVMEVSPQGVMDITNAVL